MQLFGLGACCSTIDKPLTARIQESFSWKVFSTEYTVKLFNQSIFIRSLDSLWTATHNFLHNMHPSGHRVTLLQLFLQFTPKLPVWRAGGFTEARYENHHFYCFPMKSKIRLYALLIFLFPIYVLVVLCKCLRQLVVRGSDQLESLSSFLVTAHISPFMIYVICCFISLTFCNVL